MRIGFAIEEKLWRNASIQSIGNTGNDLVPHRFMTNYRRHKLAGGTYFFTQVTHQRRPWLCTETARTTLRAAITQVRQTYPFVIEAMVLLPDHLHCLWTLPEGDSNYAIRWRLIKTYVTKQIASALHLDTELSQSRQKRREGNLWQRRFWEHWIRDERDFTQHCDYIHYSPVRHGLCQMPGEWQYSSFHRFVAQGVYASDWGGFGAPEAPLSVWDL